MTAEIAVLNKSAVALAADSAVTIGGGAKAKIYNTVNKIFELSSARPVGIMIYGRLDFMGFPLETIIKQYRADLGGKSFPHIAGYKDDFLRYLAKRVPIGDADEIRNVAVVATGFFDKFHYEIENRLLEDIRTHGKYRKGKINGLVQAVIEEEIDNLRSVPFVSGVQQARLPRHLVDVIDAVAKHALEANEPTGETLGCARRYAAQCLARAVLSDFRTGLVFAGFGDKEWCPSLEAVEIDGVINRKLKQVDYASVDITRGKVEADIIGFAQDDMMQTFLHGIDPLLRTYFEKMIGSAITDTATRIVTNLFTERTKADDVLKALQPEFDAWRDGFRTKADDYIERVATSQIRDMIRAMPKQELSNLALSLVEITSLKRKVSRVQETVGGEVDVAVISKSEGFVWTRRKHYFPRELNPRFFARHFNGEDRSAP